MFRVLRIDDALRLSVGLFLIGLLPILPGPASAQDDFIPVPEIPLTQRFPFAARYAGMGGASLAIADDHTAALSNPATLGLVRSIEFAVGFNHQNAEKDVQYRGNTSTTDFGKTRLSHLGFVYPFPTYRGSFVVGFAYARTNILDSDFLQESRGEGRRSREAIYEEGSMGAYAVSAALQVSPEVTLGASGIILSGSDFREREFRDSQSGASLLQTTDSDISGITGNIGALVQLQGGLRFGLNLYLPESVDLEGSGADSVDFSFSDTIDLPYRIGAGLAFARSNVVVAADAIFTDWTQIDYLGPLRTRDRENGYRETVELRVGTEVLFTLPTPVRLRLGYLYQPIPYRVLQTDIFTAPERYEVASFDKDRQYLTFGAGILLAESFSVDLAYLHGGFERSGKDSPSRLYSEEERDRRFLASMSLRLR